MFASVPTQPVKQAGAIMLYRAGSSKIVSGNALVEGICGDGLFPLQHMPTRSYCALGPIREEFKYIRPLHLHVVPICE